MRQTTVVTSIFLVFLLLLIAGFLLYQERWVFVSSETEETKESADGLTVDGTGLVAESPVLETNNEEQTRAIAAGSYLISGEKISGWNTEKRWPIASITKLLTALVAEEIMQPTEVVEITQSAVDTLGESGGFMAGENFQIRDLIKAMLLVSSNDAATALAQHYGEERFIAEMNRIAEEAGMENAHFVDPAGLSTQNQAPIKDLVSLVHHIWRKYPLLLQLSRQSTDLIVDTKTNQIRQLVSINQFAGRIDFLGGKTGSLPEADGNLVSVFNVAGRAEPVVIVVLGSKDRFGETTNILNGL